MDQAIRLFPREIITSRSYDAQFNCGTNYLFTKRLDCWRLSHVISLLVCLKFGRGERENINWITIYFQIRCLRFPFSWQSFSIEYFIAFFFEYAVFHFVLQTASCLLCFMIGCCLMLMAMIKDFKQELNSFDECYKVDQNQIQLEEKFKDAIQIHADAKQLSTLNESKSITHLEECI